MNYREVESVFNTLPKADPAQVKCPYIQRERVIFQARETYAFRFHSGGAYWVLPDDKICWMDTERCSNTPVIITVEELPADRRESVLAAWKKFKSLADKFDA
jgi:hypothetical protein